MKREILDNVVMIKEKAKGDIELGIARRDIKAGEIIGTIHFLGGGVKIFIPDRSKLKGGAVFLE